jgi:hypothetical protein
MHHSEYADLLRSIAQQRMSLSQAIHDNDQGINSTILNPAQQNWYRERNVELFKERENRKIKEANAVGMLSDHFKDQGDPRGLILAAAARQGLGNNQPSRLYPPLRHKSEDGSIIEHYGNSGKHFSVFLPIVASPEEMIDAPRHIVGGNYGFHGILTPEEIKHVHDTLPDEARVTLFPAGRPFTRKPKRFSMRDRLVAAIRLSRGLQPIRMAGEMVPYHNQLAQIGAEYPAILHAINHGKIIDPNEYRSAAHRDYLSPHVARVNTTFATRTDHEGEWGSPLTIHNQTVSAHLHHYPQQGRAILYLSHEKVSHSPYTRSHTDRTPHELAIEIKDPHMLAGVANDLIRNEHKKLQRPLEDYPFENAPEWVKGHDQDAISHATIGMLQYIRDIGAKQLSSGPEQMARPSRVAAHGEEHLRKGELEVPETAHGSISGVYDSWIKGMIRQHIESKIGALPISHQKELRSSSIFDQAVVANNGNQDAAIDAIHGLAIGNHKFYQTFDRAKALLPQISKYLRPTAGVGKIDWTIGGARHEDERTTSPLESSTPVKELPKGKPPNARERFLSDKQRHYDLISKVISENQNGIEHHLISRLTRIPSAMVKDTISKLIADGKINVRRTPIHKDIFKTLYYPSGADIPDLPKTKMDQLVSLLRGGATKAEAARMAGMGSSQAHVSISSAIKRGIIKSVEITSGKPGPRKKLSMRETFKSAIRMARDIYGYDNRDVPQTHMPLHKLLGIQSTHLSRRDQPVRMGREHILPTFEYVKDNPHDDQGWLELADSFLESGKPVAGELMKMVAGSKMRIDHAKHLDMAPYGTEHLREGEPEVPKTVHGSINGVPFYINPHEGYAYVGMCKPGTWGDHVVKPVAMYLPHSHALRLISEFDQPPEGEPVSFAKPVRMGREHIVPTFEYVKANPHDNQGWLELADLLAEHGKPATAELMQNISRGPNERNSHSREIYKKYGDREDFPMHKEPEVMRYPAFSSQFGHVHRIPIHVYRCSGCAFVVANHDRKDGDWHWSPSIAYIPHEHADRLIDEFDPPPDASQPVRHAKPLRAPWLLPPDQIPAYADNPHFGQGSEYYGDTPREPWLEPRHYNGADVPEGGMDDVTTGWVPVISSWIGGLRRIKGSNAVDMMVKKGGKVYRYVNAPKGLLGRWVGAGSKGKFWWNWIRNYLSPAVKMFSRDGQPIRMALDTDLLRGVAESHPDDDAPWLVLADHLHDNGYAVTAHMIRHGERQRVRKYPSHPETIQFGGFFNNPRYESGEMSPWLWHYVEHNPISGETNIEVSATRPDGVNYDDKTNHRTFLTRDPNVAAALAAEFIEHGHRNGFENPEHARMLHMATQAGGDPHAIRFSRPATEKLASRFQRAILLCRNKGVADDRP